MDRVVVTDPLDAASSEFTWHGDGRADYLTTRGNNGVAGANWDRSGAWESDPRPVASNLTFDYAYTLNNNNFRSYANASITQLFFTANMYHDLLYLLGFTERAGNFETNNNGQGGAGSDFVILNAQDGSGTNNAQFSTPPDGQPGRMLMYMWDTATPQRDCSFEAGVVIHEYTHGLSNRLTGGPSNSRCLTATESGGMGEGWSDFMATAIRTKANDTRATNYAMGAWVFNNPAGIRRYVYSTSMTTNPHVYNDITSLNGVHAIGTVWATMLYEVMWNLIDKHGNTPAIRPTFAENGVPTDGRYLAMKLVTDGMAL